MSEIIHPKAIDNMKNLLNGVLGACHVSCGYPNISMMSDGMEKFADRVLKEKKEWLTDLDVYMVIIRFIYISIQVKMTDDVKDEDINGPLNTILSAQEMTSIVDDCVSYLLSVPREYDIYFPLPNISLEGSVVELSADIRLRKFSDAEPNVSPKNKLSTINALRGPGSFESGIWYLCFREIGYFSGELEDCSFLNAVSRLKMTLYLGLAYGVFVEKDPKPWSSILAGVGYDYMTEGLKGVGVDIEIDSKINSVLLPRHISKLLQHICLNIDHFDTDQITSECVAKTLEIPALLTSNYFSFDEISSIKTAIEWAFDSMTNDNDTVSFIQACIGLEAILGDDSKKNNLTATLADRCAYLVSPRIAGRKNIRKEFEKLYDLRSKLVHGRRIRLPHEERHFLWLVKSLLKKVIIKEIANVKLS